MKMSLHGRSHELLEKFIKEIEMEEGISKKFRKKETNVEKTKRNVKVLLKAAEKGKIQLPDDESYLATPLPETSVFGHETKKGLSLVEQARNKHPKDLADKNLRYIKHVQKHATKKAALVSKMLPHESSASLVRKEREKITGLREKKVKRKSKDKSVFSEKDFAIFKKKQLKAMDLEDMW